MPKRCKSYAVEFVSTLLEPTDSGRSMSAHQVVTPEAPERRDFFVDFLLFRSNVRPRYWVALSTLLAGVLIKPN